MSSDSNDGGYVHTPGGLDTDDESASDTSDTAGSDEPTGWEFSDRETADGEASEEGLGWTGWVLVAVVVVATVVIPGVIYLFPTAPGEAGLPFLIAMLVLPFLPAVLLGATAVLSLTTTNE